MKHVADTSEERYIADSSNLAWLKLALLADGVRLTARLTEWYASQRGVVRRRDFYNSAGTEAPTAGRPQEIRLKAPVPIVTAVNSYASTAWTLDIDDEGPHIWGHGTRTPVEALDDLPTLTDDPETARLSNLYGGSALAFFSPRSCYFFARNTECRFCSLDGTAHESAEFASHVTPSQVAHVVQGVIDRDSRKINQVMIVGGNETDLDRGFRRQVDLVKAASAELVTAGVEGEISVHLIVMPPRSLDLINLLADLPNVHIGFNLEVWDKDVFESMAPGKHADYGRDQLLRALRNLVDVVGPYRAHSILIAGLEPPGSTLEGAHELAAMGVSPIINAYHSDRHSALGQSIRPTYSQLAQVAAGLQRVHDEFPIRPYWTGCGRNAIDYEASLRLFATAAPEY